MSRKDNIVSICYKGVWLIFFRIISFLSTIFFKIKLLCLSVQYGKGLHSYGFSGPSLRISLSAGNVSIGDNVIFNNYNDAGWYSKCSLWVKDNASLTIGNNSGFNGVFIYSAKSVTIGSNVKVGGGTRIFDTDFHPIDYVARRTTIEGTKTAPVVIEDDVFIGTNCIVEKGVHIGARSIIAAGSVVVKSVPSDEIWGGNPAHFIKKLQ